MPKQRAPPSSEEDGTKPPVDGCRDDLPSSIVGEPSNPCLPTDLAPGQSVVVSARVHAEDEPGHYVLSGIYSWREGSTSKTSTVQWEPVTVTSSWALEEGFFGLLKDLALPIVVVLLGVWFRASEQRRANVQEIWSQMLHISHHNAERHYMPSLTAINRLLVDHGRWTSSSGNEKERLQRDLLLDLLVFLRKVLHQLQEIGGFYFKNRLGEDIVVGVWKMVRKEAEFRLGRRELDLFLARIEPTQTPGELNFLLEAEADRPSWRRATPRVSLKLTLSKSPVREAME